MPAGAGTGAMAIVAALPGTAPIVLAAKMSSSVDHRAAADPTRDGRTNTVCTTSAPVRTVSLRRVALSCRCGAMVVLSRPARTLEAASPRVLTAITRGVVED